MRIRGIHMVYAACVEQYLKEVFMKHVVHAELTMRQKQALDAASFAMENAYNPYSRFFAGAALIPQNGEIITGSNVENAAYGSTICAERAAVMRTNAMGVRKFSGIAIIGRGEDFDTTKITGPCGSCRQVLYEISQISGIDLEVVLSTTNQEKIVVTTISELLPLAFGPLDLGMDISRYQR